MKIYLKTPNITCPHTADEPFMFCEIADKYQTYNADKQAAVEVIHQREVGAEFNGRKQQSVKETEDVKGCCSLQSSYHKQRGRGGRSTTRARVLRSADSSASGFIDSF